VGDSLGSDVQGGINAGLRATVWVQGALGPRKAGDPEPTYTVHDVAGLPAIIDQLLAADAA
jgi:N-acylneuraminate-9-phosphatase